MDIKVIGNIYGMGVYCFKDKDGEIVYVGSGMMNDRLSNYKTQFANNKYKGTNKEVLQDLYNKGDLTFEVLHYSENNSEYINGSKEFKKAIQQSLEVLEQFYYNLYKDTCCNKITNIHKWSTSPSEDTTAKRSEINKGSNNPNSKYNEELVCNVLYLKNKGVKPRVIKDIIYQEFGIDISSHYIYCIGNTKWVHISPKYDAWMNKYIEVA
jgi:hypothetical protein